MVGAALGYLLLQQGEAVGLIGHREVPASALPARTGRAHLVRLLATLQQMEASGRTDLSGAARHAAQRLGRRGLIVLFSDLYGEDGWHAALREVRRMGHEVAVLHVLAPEERTLSLGGEVELVDMESGERLVMAAARVKADYESRLSAFVNDQRAFARAEGITYVDASTTRGPDEVLRALVRLRLQGDGPAR
jgi:uncharacterized protein (DUF58 family)